MIKREEFLNILKDMPDEAFDWFIIATLPSNETHKGGIWPDGIGGFTNESEKAINDLRILSRKYLHRVAK